MDWKLRVLSCGLGCLLVATAAGQPQPNSMEELLAKVREEKVDPYQVGVAASELAKQHPQFLELFRQARVLRNERFFFKLMNDHKMADLEQSITWALADPERLLRTDAAGFLPTIRDRATFLEQLLKALKNPGVEVRWLAAKACDGP